MVRVAYIQTVDELLAEELDAGRLEREIAAGVADPGPSGQAFTGAAREVAERLRQTPPGELHDGTTPAAMLPGNVAYTARMTGAGFRVAAVVLECRRWTDAARA